MRQQEDEHYKLIRIDKNGKLISKALPYTTKTIQSLRCPFVQVGKDNYIFSEYMCDTIFSINNEVIKPLFHINMGKDLLPYDCRVDLPMLNDNAYKYYLKIDLLSNEMEYISISQPYAFSFGEPVCSFGGMLLGKINSSSLNLHKRNPRFELEYRVSDKIPEMEKLRKTRSEMDNPSIVRWGN